jgi:hypothetical protein
MTARGHRVRTDERDPGGELVRHRQRHRTATAPATPAAGAERAPERGELIVAVDDGDGIDVAGLDRAVRVQCLELEAGAADRCRLEPVGCQTEVLGELHLVHPAVARAREPTDVTRFEAGIVERAPKRLRFEHRPGQVRRDRPVGQTDADDTHVSMVRSVRSTGHGAGT